MRRALDPFQVLVYVEYANFGVLQCYLRFMLGGGCLSSALWIEPWIFVG